MRRALHLAISRGGIQPGREGDLPLPRVAVSGPARTEDVVWNDITYAADTKISSRDSLSYLKAAYRFGFLRNDRAEGGVSAGLATMRFATEPSSDDGRLALHRALERRAGLQSNPKTRTPTPR